MLISNCEKRDRGALTPTAWQARSDPAAFISCCLTDPRGEPLELAAVHRELQSQLSRNRHALVELPRDHGKSTQVCGRVLWELGRDPALRIKIVCATETIAAERSRFLRDAIANHRAVRKVFPWLEADKPWTAAAFTIQRPAAAIGPSVCAFGVGAGSTGTRADLLICDDAVDVHAMHSKTERDRVADYFANNLMNLLEPDGRCWILFTPWHLDDVNARLKRNEMYTLFHRAVGPELQAVWLEKWPSAGLQSRKAEVGTASFARGYRLVPMAEEETPIRAAWVKYWTEEAPCETVILSVDPAVSTREGADASALVVLGKCVIPNPLAPFPDREGGADCLLAPPSLSGKGAGGLGSSSHIRVLACTARRVATPELVGLIEQFDREWNPAVILFETNAAFLGIKDLLTRHAEFGGKLKNVTQSANKSARIAAFSVAVENGAFLMKGDGSQSALFDEMTTFPFGQHDDLLDAAATGCAYLLDRREPRVW